MVVGGIITAHFGQIYSKMFVCVFSFFTYNMKYTFPQTIIFMVTCFCFLSVNKSMNCNTCKLWLTMFAFLPFFFQKNSWGCLLRPKLLQLPSDRTWNYRGRKVSFLVQHNQINNKKIGTSKGPRGKKYSSPMLTYCKQAMCKHK